MRTHPDPRLHAAADQAGSPGEAGDLRPAAATLPAPETVLDFREIGDHLYDGVYIADGTGKTLYVNKSYQRITGLDASELVGRQVEDIVAEGLYVNPVTPEVLRQRKQVNSVGQSMRNGATLLITGIPIFDEDGQVKLVAVIEREITDLLEMQIELEATQQKMRAVEAVEIRTRREIEHLRKQALNANIVGVSPQIARVLELVHRVAAFDVTVLIRGETGVGKEVVANEIHASSARSGRPFIKVNCAALPSGLLEAELFGYERGAFTGAAPGGKPGLFELADHGSILLDEIGDLPIELQGKLLRAIEHKEMTRVGGFRSIHLDVRIMAATNCDLHKHMRQGRFREDLYYRLSVFPVEIAPLRERREDVVVLARHFLGSHNRKYGKAIRIGREASDLLAQYNWPGNVRELQNVIERIVLICEPHAIVSRDHIAALLGIGAGAADGAELSLKERVEALERSEIERALCRYGTTRKAAAALGIDQSTIVKKARRLGVHAGDDERHHDDAERHPPETAGSGEKFLISADLR